MKKDQIKFLKKLVTFYDIIFGIVMFVFFAVLFNTINISESRMLQLGQNEITNQTLNQLDHFLLEMDNVSYHVMTNNKIINIFNNLKSDGSDENYFSKNILANIDTASILGNINGTLSPIWRISVYNEYGDFISSGAVVEKKICSTKLQEKLKIKQEIEELRVSKSNIKISPPQSDSWSDFYRSQYISIKRPVMNVYSKETYGMVEVQQNINSLLSYFKFSDLDNILVNVYDDKGSPVIIQDSESVQAIKLKSETYGWSIELVFPSDALSTIIRFLAFLFIWIVLILIFHYIISLISAKVAKPIVDLKNAVKLISIGNIPEMYTTDNNIDEVIELEDAFNHMLKKLKQSIELEKRANFLAMQAQMNPHFLYNTLGVISAEGMASDNMKIVNMCANLSDMLRYVTTYKNEVTVREEIKHTKEYLELMKYRNFECFEYSIVCCEESLDLLIPKLIIQPLSENCFMHSFSQTEPPYKINIEVSLTQRTLIIKIDDNGAGFTKEKKAYVLQKANSIQVEDLIDTELGGLGLLGSISRLNVFTDGNVTCEINDVMPHGSIIIIRCDLK